MCSSDLEDLCVLDFQIFLNRSAKLREVLVYQEPQPGVTGMGGEDKRQFQMNNDKSLAVQAGIWNYKVNTDCSPKTGQIQSI